MSRKKFFGLVPLLAITAAVAALAVMPAAAQALVPRIFLDGSEVGSIGAEESAPQKAPTIAWGTLRLSNGELGEITCHNIFAGAAINPGAEKGEKTLPGEAPVETYESYNCTGPKCETSGGHIEISPLSEGENVLGNRIKTERIVTPWEGVLKERNVGPAGTFDLYTGNKAKAFEATGKTTAASKKITLLAPSTEVAVGQKVFDNEDIPLGGDEITKVNSTTEFEVAIAATKTNSLAKLEFEAPKANGRIRFEIFCHAINIHVEFHGQLHSKALNNGTTKGSNPSEVKLEKPGENIANPEGSGELESNPAGGGSVAGNVKLMGYSEQGLLLTKGF